MLLHSSFMAIGPAWTACSAQIGRRQSRPRNPHPRRRADFGCSRGAAIVSAQVREIRRAGIPPRLLGARFSRGHFMRTLIRLGCFAVLLFGMAVAPAAAQETPQPADSSHFAPGELVDAGHRLFGGVSRGLAQIIERAVSQWGLPNAYVLGQEAGG